MTNKLKRGDRVKFAVEGTVGDVCEDGSFFVRPDGNQAQWAFDNDRVGNLTVIPKPIRVGDKVKFKYRLEGVLVEVLSVYKDQVWVKFEDDSCGTWLAEELTCV